MPDFATSAVKTQCLTGFKKGRQPASFFVNMQWALEFLAASDAEHFGAICRFIAEPLSRFDPTPPPRRQEAELDSHPPLSPTAVDCSGPR